MKREGKDPALVELVEYFDSPGVAPNYEGDEGGWVRLNHPNNARELAAVESELRKCRQDFSYFSRNFLYIRTKEREKIPFRLNESQELILEKIYALKSMGLPQRIIILKARQLGALHPKTKVLTANLDWVSIHKLKPGDQVVAVDENIPGGRGAGRKFRTAQVLDKWEVTKEAFKITLANGVILVATGDHPFLCKRRGGTEAIWRKVNEKEPGKKTSSPILPGDEIRFVCETWDRDFSFEDGWFSGLLDGEGSLRQKDNGGIELSVSQVEGAVLRRAISYLSGGGYAYRMEVDTRKSGISSKLGNQPVYKLVINRAPHIFRLLGTTKPTRFIERHPWVGKDLPSSGEGQSWVKVVSVESVGNRRMIDIQTSTGTFIAEGAVTHNCSTLIEGLLTWRTVLFMNTIAVIVSSNPDHAAYLFRMLQFFYDNLPWWMRPMTLSRKIEEGLIFDNPNHKDRHLRGGLNSEISVQAANQGAGVGQGRTVQAAHASEIGDWTDEEGKSVIEGDLGHALAQNVETFAAIESTAKGTGNYFHRLWRRNVELGEMANWHPVFLPWFFEKNRKIIIPSKAWKPSYQEIEMRDRLANEWLRCTNKNCLQFLEKFERGVDQTGIKCHGCGIGDMEPYFLTDQQMHWMQRERLNAEKDADSLKAMKAEICSTAEEAFQLSGVQVFPQECLDFVNRYLEEPKARGYLDKAGTLHGIDAATGRCPQPECDVDHSYEELPLHVFRYPEKNYTYVGGVDVSEGLGEDSDSSIIFINKVGGLREPDEQVALFRSNTISPVEFAHPVSMMGHWYNDAMLSIEINKYDTTFSYVRQNYSYPNLYRWKHVDSTNMLSQKWGWETNMKSKPRLWQTGTYWLKNRSWIIHSKNFYQEMTTFQKESAEDRGAKAEKGFYDDEIMAGLIALYCSHDSDWDENLGMIPIRRSLSGDPEAYMWRIVCNVPACGYQRGVPSPEGCMYCLECGSKYVRAEKNANLNISPNLWEELESGSDEPRGSLAEPEYELM